MKALPEALSGYKQFIVYKLVPSSKRPGKTDKFPCDFRTGAVVSAHDEQYWTDCDTAIAAAVNFGESYGIGFVLTSACGIFCIDIDNCLLPDSSDWSPIAKELCAMFPGAYIEVSRSGKGLHIFARYSIANLAHASRNAEYGIELYTDKRFIALTGTNAIGDANLDCSVALSALITKYFPGTISERNAEWTTAPRDDWKGPESDEDLIRRAMRSRGADSAFGGKASFADLWNCNIEALARTYPDVGRAYNESQADAALAQHLAFWTGNNCERIERLMMQSKLVREKWEREDYIERTIINAVSKQFDVLTDKTFELPAEAVAKPNEQVKPVIVQGSTFATNDDQIALFAGCVYVNDCHRVLVPGGNLLKPEQFKVAYGGYTFTMDAANEKTTRDAWEAFTQNQSFRCPRVDTTCFKPDMAPGAIIDRNGIKAVNTYWPVQVKRKVGDATPILDHLSKLFPNENDRLICLSFAAACVQYQGKKFGWAPLIQGVEGNGKTIISYCIQAAIGDKYVHFPPAAEISEKFNSWLFGNIFIGVHDVFVPNQKRELFEILKPMISDKRLAKRAMHSDQVMQDVVANFIFNCNPKDGLIKTNNDRRIAPLFCAQQNEDDLAKYGMDERYFRQLIDWLEKEDGYAITSELLHTWPIPRQFDPTKDALRAPITSSTKDAINASMGGIEQEILEAIAQGLPGFCGGWISSIMLDRLLEKLGAARRVTHYKRKEMLNSMGYDYHPALHDGRVNNVVLPDNSKPRLFIKKDAAARNIATAAEVGRSYEMSNNNIVFKV